MSDDSYPIDNLIFFRLFQTANVLQTRSVGTLGITAIQWSVLGALSTERAKDGIRFSDLADYLQVSRQNLDGVVGRMERDGYVRRVADAADRRARFVQITDQGQIYWQSLLPGISRFYDAATAGFSLDDKIAFGFMLQKLRRNLTDMAEAPPEQAEPKEAAPDAASLPD